MGKVNKERSLREEIKADTSSSTITVSSNSVKAYSSSVVSPNVIMLIIIPALMLGVYAIAVTLWESQYVHTLIDQPLDLPFVMTEWKEPERTVWSSYRPSVYVAMQPMVPKSVSIGLAWFVQRDGDIHLHHECIGGHCLSQQWTKHDGSSFGQQIIHSSEGFLMKSEFISDTEPSYGDTWTLRVTAEPLRKMQRSFLSVIIYVYDEGRGQMDLNGNIDKGMVEEIFGHTPEMREYRIHFPYKFLTTKNTAYSFLRTHVSSDVNISNLLLSSLDRNTPIDKYPSLYTLSNNMTTPFNSKVNFIAYQITSLLMVPIEIDTVYESGMYSAAISISGKRFTELSQIRHANFDQRFESKFNLLSKGFSMEKVIMCKSILSSVLGSIKYGYNNNLRVIKGDSVPPKNYFSFPFLSSTATTKDGVQQYSLIDEGYHQLLILQWNVNITKAVIGHWLDTMNIDGWIPSHWSVVGGVNNSGGPLDTTLINAPTLFLTLDSLITQMEKNKEMDYEFLKQVLPRLEIWYDWINETQAGQIPGTFQWNGRKTDSMTLNPETPTSGMSDYPRSSDAPHYGDYHLDLKCWMTLGARVLARIVQLVGEETSYYSTIYRDLMDQKKLDQLHWDNKRKVYSDYGYHNQNVKMARTKSGEIIKKTTGVASLRYVNSLGYVNLFPLLFTILSPDSSRLGYSLKQLHDSSLLWSQYGVRSLAKSDQFYHKSNDPNVKQSYSWRGPVHIHVNYLILRALNHYRHSPGPYAEIADKTYVELRKNLIDVVIKEYSRTGFLWSYYDDKTGHGKGARYSGLSSLILLIMAEIY